MSDVLLVTCADLPQGEEEGALLVAELGRRGLSASWVAWDDPGVDWAGSRLAVVRATWDYERRHDEFVAWAHRVGRLTTLANPAHVLEWNTDKVYLLDLLEAGLPVVPTLAVADESELISAVAGFGTAVVKPRIGAGGRGVVVLGPRTDRSSGEVDRPRLDDGPWVVQPLVESVRTEGETSVFVLGGRAVSQVSKRPGGSEIRVHEEYGGRTDAVPLTDEARELALRTVTSAERLLDETLSYARVDMMRGAAGSLVVSELEVAEPGLYLDVVPANAPAFAEAVVALLAPRT